jgi:uncharacterized protein with LGFP repeats
MFALQKMFGNRRASGRRKGAVQRRPLRPALEQLEDRVVPSLDAIQAKYLALGGPQGFLGQPLTGEMATPYGGGLFEEFQGGAIFWSSRTGAHEIHGAIESEFFSTAYEQDAYGAAVQQILGLPTSDEMDVSGVSGARMNTFEGGNIYWSWTTGAHVVYGGIGAKYNSLGGPTAYGLPTTDEAGVSGVSGARIQTFQTSIYYPGFIEWSAATGAHTIYGAIGAEYTNTAYETGYYGDVVQQDLGAATSDEMDVPGVSGARMNTFQGGSIYWSPSTGAHVVYGGIGAKYNSLGGPTAYGLPTTDETDAYGVPGVRVQQFQTSSYYAGLIEWSAATGAHTIYGAIGAEYMATANETDYYGDGVQWILGAPTSDEMDVPGVPGARMNTFQGGNIYWSPSTGGHVVYGGIGALYDTMGGPTSYLGLPTSDEQGVAGGRVSYFQNGKIVWTPDGGAYAVQIVSQMTFGTGNFDFGSGFFDPTVQGRATLTVYADGSYNFVGNFHDSGAFDYNDSLMFGLVSTSGVLYTFTHTGSVAGWTDFWNSSDDNWDVSGTNPALAAGWADLQGAQFYWKADVSWNVDSLLQEIKDAAGIVGAVISIV